MWGIISIILVWQGLKRDFVGILLTAGVFAIASVMSWML